MKRKLALLFSLLPMMCYSAEGSEAIGENAVASGDDKLFHEIVDEFARSHNVCTRWTFDGSITNAMVMTNQSHDADGNCFPSLEGDVYIKYDNQYNGLGYGLEIGNKIRNGLLKGGAAIVDTSYVYVESDKYGKFKFGYTNSAADTFSLSYASVLTGYAGPDSGNLSNFYAQTSGSIIATGFERDDNKSLKVVWLSPTINGWSMGLSYSPSSRDAHLFKEDRNKIGKDYSPAQNFADQTSYSRHNFTGGIAYEYGTPDAFNAKIAVAGWYAQGESDFVKVRKVCGYNVGAILGYKEYKLAMGYTDNGKSLLPSNFSDTSVKTGYCHGADAGKVYNIGLGYTKDKWELSVGYFHAVKKFASNERTNSNVATVATQYNFNKTLSAFVEYNNIRTRACARAIATENDSAAGGDGSAVENNRANMLIVGTKINF
ncbi:MAG: hypothetical protein E7015_01165 [Alphaproteobacteria bacterium]|nr:hypothetical protein [Alphaproteobacteria bacterium]